MASLQQYNPISIKTAQVTGYRLRSIKLTIIAVLLIVLAFVGGWAYTAHTLATMGPLLRHLMGIPVGFVAMFCVAAILFFTGVIAV